MARERIVAVGLLTQSDLDLLGPALSRVFTLDDSACFDGLIDAINAADRELEGEAAAENRGTSSNRLT